MPDEDKYIPEFIELSEWLIPGFQHVKGGNSDLLPPGPYAEGYIFPEHHPLYAPNPNATDYGIEEKVKARQYEEEQQEPYQYADPHIVPNWKPTKEVTNIPYYLHQDMPHIPDFEDQYNYFRNQGYSDEEASAKAEKGVNWNPSAIQSEKESIDTTTTSDTDKTTSEPDNVFSFLKELLKTSQPQSITPSLDYNIPTKSDLNDIQMIAMKVKSINPQAAEELWNMSNIPLEQILEIYDFRYNVSLANQSERRNYNGMVQTKKYLPRKKSKKAYR